jgi:transcriptional antiterminator RfaH
MINMDKAWYALRSKPRKETFLAGELASRNLEIFCPMLRIRPVNPRSRTLKPYFPGYLFAHCDLERVQLSTLQWTPGAIGIVSFGGEPASVPDGLIAAIRKRVDEINAVGGEVFEGLKPGDPIRIREGIFAGYEGIFDARLDGNDRVRVLLKVLRERRLVPVDLRAGQIAQTNRR